MNRVIQRPIQGFAAALGAVAVLSIMDAIMKHLVLAIGIVAVSIWRAAANLGLSAILYLPRRGSWPDRRTMRVHVARSIIVTVMAALFFWGIGRVPLAQGIALTFIAPLIAMLLAAATLDERIGRNSAVGSLGAFAGVLVIVIGQASTKVAGDVLLGIAAIIGSALCYAVNIVLMRHQALAARPLEINFFQCVTVMMLWLLAVPLAGIPALPGGQWLWVVIAALLSTSGTLLFAWGYARGPASYLATTEYSGFLWASLMGWLVFRERVSFSTLGGAMLIVGGCLVAARGKITAPPEIDVAA
ncbi:MAG TPA: DMT family transporter [Sphingomicrobium sp.]|nr:DMT family transporter [Sphingomicrobium sp.]